MDHVGGGRVLSRVADLHPALQGRRTDRRPPRRRDPHPTPAGGLRVGGVHRADAGPPPGAGRCGPRTADPAGAAARLRRLARGRRPPPLHPRGGGGPAHRGREARLSPGPGTGARLLSSARPAARPRLPAPGRHRPGPAAVGRPQ
ncbi:hypothetical protein SGPA1_20561 [Streptomyces misionensis JCM 4497]